jgi:hypothetical protein
VLGLTVAHCPDGSARYRKGNWIKRKRGRVSVDVIRYGLLGYWEVEFEVAQWGREKRGVVSIWNQEEQEWD